MIKVTLGPGYDQKYRSLVEVDPELADLVADRIHLFKKNPEDTRLANHSLRRKMKGKWAFSVTDDIRVVYEWVNKTTARFLAIGPHYKVYLKR